MEPIRSDWRISSLLPAAAFGGVLFLGFLAWNWAMLQTPPFFGWPQLGGTANLRSALGAFIAGKHAIVAATFLLILAATLLVIISGWTIRSIYLEITDEHSMTYMQRVDARASLFLVAVVLVIVAAPAMKAILGRAQCGTARLYECLGREVMPDLLNAYVGRMFIKDSVSPTDTLDWAANLGNAAVALAGFALLAAMVMLPRGLEQGFAAGRLAEEVRKAAPDPVPYKLLTIGELKTWFSRRVRRFEQLSFITSLVLVAGIAQMSAWMKWPLAIINKDTLIGDATAIALHANYETLTDSVLQYSAIWYGAMVAALIFTTRLVLSRKCRQLADELIADADTSQADKDEAQKLIDETFAGTTAQVYFERYRTYLLALAPAIAQQLLQAFGG